MPDCARHQAVSLAVGLILSYAFERPVFFIVNDFYDPIHK
jgi:large-conductance mechanosensitive channel